MRKLAAVLAAVFLLVLFSGTALAWFAAVEGVPGALHQAEKGIFIWHDNEGIHIRGVSKHQRTVFTGTVETNGRFYAIQERGLEGGDHLRVDGDHNTLRFRFTVHGGVDGVDFRVQGGNRLSFVLDTNGRNAHPADINVGREGWHPGDNRFTLWR